jgi:hypothetical protein
MDILYKIIFYNYPIINLSRDISAGKATAYGLDARYSNPRRGKIFFSPQRRPALRPIQSPIQWVLEANSQGLRDRGVKLATHLHLVPRSTMVELYLHFCIYDG